MQVRVVPHDPNWSLAYETESRRIMRVLGSEMITLHHIGSTSISGIYAKPIVDMLGVVENLADLDKRSSEMAGIGYEVMGEYGIPGRRYFRLDDENGIRRFHLHAFVAGSEGVIRHLAFRDFLRSHPDTAQEYSELKIRLAMAHPDSIDHYMDGKDGFVKEVQAKAVQWYGAA